MASTQLTRTPGSSGNTQKYTYSLWIKRSKISSNQIFFNVGAGDTSADDYIYFHSSNNLRYYNYAGATENIGIVTNRLFRDTNSWYHIVVAVDTTQATASDRVKIYINGEQETSFSSSNYPSQNLNVNVNSTDQHWIGSRGDGVDYFDGSMAHVHLIDGTAYDASAFGETDATTGIWKPKTAPSVTYGTNGFFLKFENSGSMGTDSSGNANNFTVNGNLTQTIDTPSNVFATMNPLQAGSYGTLSNGNLTWYGNTATNQGNVYPTLYCTGGGKWYWEVKIEANDGVGYPAVGLAGDVGNRAFGVLNGGTASNGFYDSSTDVKWNYASTTINSPSGNVTGVTAFGNGDIIMFALDRDNGKFYMGRNGTWLNSGDPTSGATGTGSILNFTTTGTEQAVMLSTYNGSQLSANFGNGYFGTTPVSSAQNPDDGIGIFEYAVPTGYKALCTKSINAQEYS
jgi:hypothetical protein